MAEFSRFLRSRYGQMIGGQETEKLIEAMQKPLRESINANQIRTTDGELEKRLAEKGFELEKIPWAEHGYFVNNSPYSIGSSTEHLLGYYYVQGAASMLPAEELKPRAGEVVVDMCAAPGGKTVQLAQYMQNKGVLIALEKNRERLKSLRANAERCGVENAILVRADAAELPELIGGDSADKILLDAPCSGEGVIRKQLARADTISQKDFDSCAIVQKQLISAAIKALKKGGILVYSTCSLAPEENEYVVQYALDNFDIELLPVSLKIGRPGYTSIFGRELSGELEKTRRIFPHERNTEGFYIAKIRKK